MNFEKKQNRNFPATLCYCDAFCDRSVNADCCPDYWSVCLNAPDPITKCRFDPPVMDNCNLCRCLITGQEQCDTDLCLIDNDLIKNVNLMHPTWRAKNYTEFWGRKYSEGLKLRTGTFEPMYTVKRMSRLSNKMDGVSQSFDARQNWPNSVSEPKDQGWCGSSWVVSTAAVASDRFAILSKGKEMVDLSAQQLLSCVRKQQGCNGGHLDVAWSYLRKTGVVEEGCYPYIAEHKRCKVRARDNLLSLGCEVPTKVPRTDLYKMGPAYALNNETDIQKEIQTSGPVQATMRVYRDFFTYSSGIYKHSSASRSDPAGFHSVKLIGWGEEHGTKYWVSCTVFFLNYFNLRIKFKKLKLKF